MKKEIIAVWTIISLILFSISLVFVSLKWDTLFYILMTLTSLSLIRLVISQSNKQKLKSLLPNIMGGLISGIIILAFVSPEIPILFNWKVVGIFAMIILFLLEFYLLYPKGKGKRT